MIAGGRGEREKSTRGGGNRDHFVLLAAICLFIRITLEGRPDRLCRTNICRGFIRNNRLAAKRENRSCPDHVRAWFDAEQIKTTFEWRRKPSHPQRMMRIVNAGVREFSSLFFTLVGQKVNWYEYHRGMSYSISSICGIILGTYFLCFLFYICGIDMASTDG